MANKNQGELRLDPKILTGAAWAHSEDLKELDESLVSFYRDPQKSAETNWIHRLLRGVGLSYSGLAEKLDVSRQAVKQLETREANGKVTLATMKAMRRLSTAISLMLLFRRIMRLSRT
jgi:DNA-binding XRE family transcriptional regulator